MKLQVAGFFLELFPFIQKWWRFSRLFFFPVDDFEPNKNGLISGCSGFGSFESLDVLIWFLLVIFVTEKGIPWDENHHETPTIWENMFWYFFQTSNKQIQVNHLIS